MLSSPGPSLLYVKGKVFTWQWKPRYFKLGTANPSALCMLGYRTQEDAERHDIEQYEDRYFVTGVYDVPERNGMRQHRFDITAESVGARPDIMVSLAATSEHDKRAWVDAVAAHPRGGRRNLSDHRRASEFQRTALVWPPRPPGPNTSAESSTLAGALDGGAPAPPPAEAATTATAAAAAAAQDQQARAATEAKLVRMMMEEDESVDDQQAKRMVEDLLQGIFQQEPGMQLQEAWRILEQAAEERAAQLAAAPSPSPSPRPRPDEDASRAGGSPDTPAQPNGAPAPLRVPAPQNPKYAEKKFAYKAKDKAVAKWAKQAGSSARKVELAGCTKITDACILQIARSCPWLANLDVGSCRGVTDDSIVEIARSCPALAAIELSYGPEVTDVGIAEIARCCPALTYIGLSGCPGRRRHGGFTTVTPAGVAEFKSKLPNCNVHFWPLSGFERYNLYDPK